MCSAHLIPFDLITLTILGEEYKLLNSSARNVLHPAVTSSHDLFPYFFICG
jgi:hypothetical protein